MMVEIHEITPELVRELSDELEANEIRSLVAAEVRDLSDQYKDAQLETKWLLARCQIRAIKLQNLGVKRDEIARMFDVDVRTVAKWLRSTIEIPVEGWRNG
jgi:DNA-binding transcriptional regulator YiaG